MFTFGGMKVCQGTDSEKKDAAVEILKEMKDVMELSKKMRLDLSSAAEPVKPLDKPADRAPKDKHAGKVPSSEKSSSSDKPGWKFRADNSNTAAHRLLVETKKGAGPSKTTDHTKQQGRLPQGSYVIGGSPIGWNFLLWPGRKAVYYGLTKEEWLARRSAK